MFSEFDKLLQGFSTDDYVNYWYDAVCCDAEDMLAQFNESDWEALFEALPERTLGWKRRLAYCMNEEKEPNQLKVLLILIDTNDGELFELAVDALRDFTSEESLAMIKRNPEIISRVKELLNSAGIATKSMLEDFLKRF